MHRYLQVMKRLFAKTNVVTSYNNQVVEALNKWKKCFSWD